MRSTRIVIFQRRGTTPNNPAPQLPLTRITFETAPLDELHFLTKHRVIHYPTWLFLDEKDRVVLKVHTTVPDNISDMI